MATTATPMSANQTAYLTNLSKTGSAGNKAWANTQLANGAPQKTATPQSSGTPQINKTGSDPNMMYASSAPIPVAAEKPATSTPQTAQAWINNSASGQGGVDAYTAKQNEKLTAAQASGNTDMLNRLAADSQRTGLTYTGNQSNTTAAPVTATPVSAPVTATQTTATPTNSDSYPGQLNNSQIQAEAQARIDKQLAAARTAAGGALTGAKNAFDYTNQITGDRRTLETADFKENSNPFSGKTGYLEANMLRDRGIADTATNNQYNAQVSQINQKLQDIQTAAPGDQQAMIDQLTKQERDYGIQLGALTGQINGQNTMQQNQNNFNNSIAQAGVTGQLPQSMGGGQTQQAQAQSFNQNMQVSEQAYSHARDSIMDERYKQKFDQDVKQLGFENAIKTALQQHQISNDNAQLAISKQNANSSSQNAGTSAGNAAWAKDPTNPDNLYKQSEVAKNNATANKSTVDPKVSTDNHATITKDLAGAKDAAEANALIEANKANLTDADYKDLKKKVIDQF